VPRLSEEALRVHGRGHREHDVGRHQAALDQGRDLGKIVRDEVAPAALAAGARGAAEEQGGVAHVLGRVLVKIAVLAHRQDLRDPDAAPARALSDSAVSRVGGSPTPVGTMIMSPSRRCARASTALPRLAS
jgi:hypothetical protein